MDSTTTSNTANPPSIELAYKKKCIQLKKRLNEIEAENDLIRARNKRAKFYVAKMRLETCIMLERLATVTGMLDEASSATAGQKDGQISSELRAKAAAIVQSAHAQTSQQDMMDDETEGSSEDQPPTPQERPLRVKRSRKSNIAFEEIEAEAAMQYDEANSPEKAASDAKLDDNDEPKNNSEDQEQQSQQEHENNNTNDDTPAAVAENRDVATTKASSSDDRRSSGFRAVNKLNDNEGGPVPMDVDDEKPSKSDS